MDKHCFNENTTPLNGLEKYRDYFLAKNILEHNFIGFYQREFACLDNFSSFAIVYKGVRYPTVEHAYQAMKFIDTAPNIASRIAQATSPNDAKRIAFSNQEKQNPNWHDIKVDIMEDLLRTKLDQHPYVKQKLIKTKDYTICEDSPIDTFWGIGENRDGQNQLGKLWMKLRDEIK